MKTLLTLLVAEEYFAKSADLAEQRVIVTRTGLGHGLLYTPHSAWLDPAVEWIKSSQEPSNSTLNSERAER